MHYLKAIASDVPTAGTLAGLKAGTTVCVVCNALDCQYMTGWNGHVFHVKHSCLNCGISFGIAKSFESTAQHERAYMASQWDSYSVLRHQYYKSKQNERSELSSNLPEPERKLLLPKD